MALKNAFANEIIAKMEELKDVVLAEYEKTRNKKKDPDLDRSTIKVRIPEDFLVKIVKMHMNTAACKNKGFIIDGYPRTQADAKAIFLDKNEEASAEDDPFQGFTINAEILPQYVIVL